MFGQRRTRCPGAPPRAGAATARRLAAVACSLFAVLAASASPAWVPAPGAREAAPSRRVLASLVALQGLQLAVPAGAARAEAGRKVTTPKGVEYEELAPGTTGTERRDGPPKSASRVWVRYTGHLDSFDGPVFEGSKFRGARKPSQLDYVEVTVGSDPSIPPGMWEAVKQMKVGEKGRYVQPGNLAYANGGMSFDGDEDSEVKGRNIPANTTTYYDIELVNIVRP